MYTYRGANGWCDLLEILSQTKDYTFICKIDTDTGDLLFSNLINFVYSKESCIIGYRQNYSQGVGFGSPDNIAVYEYDFTNNTLTNTNNYAIDGITENTYLDFINLRTLKYYMFKVLSDVDSKTGFNVYC